jgi:Tol biopolymer transport system component
VCGTKPVVPVFVLSLSVAALAVACSCAQQRKAVPVTAVVVSSVKQFTHDGIAKTNLISDESHLYVTERLAARHIVTKYSINGTDRAVVPGRFDDFQALDISRDHSSLLITPRRGSADNSEFWSLPLNAGAPHKIGDLAGRDASWSADGTHLTYGEGSSLFIANADGTGAREVFIADGSVFAPHLSVDGKRIRFTVSNVALNTTTLWEVNSDGSNSHALLNNWQHASTACCGGWTADGRYYIFQVTETFPTTVTTLWALPDAANSAHNAPFPLTTGPMSFGNASMSRNGNRIWAIGVQPTAEAVKFDVASKKFVSLLSGVSATDLDFSADGKWVSYVAVPDGTLWRCRTDGSDRRQLTAAPDRTALPRWSPDGKQIAYVSMQLGKPWKISTITPDGGAPQDILVENHGQIDANWSRDGSRIMFGYLRVEGGGNIRIVNLRTHEVTTVPGSDGLFSPRWSPDGRYIAALSIDNTRVMLFDYETQKWSTWLEEAAGAVSYPVWSADSKYLYFDDLVTDEESIRRVEVGKRQTEKVLKLEGIERYPGPFGLWSGRMADGSSMFVRDRSSQEVYELSVVLP